MKNKFKTLFFLFLIIQTATVLNFSYAQSWNDVGSPGLSNSWGSNNELVFENDSLFLSYTDGINNDLIVKFWDGNNWTQLGGVVATDVDYQMIKRHNHTLYCAFKDNTNAGKLSVKKYNGTSWEYLGSPGISTDEVNDISMAFYQNNLYVAYNDASTKLSMKMFDGTNWSFTSENISTFPASRVNLGFWGSNPSIAYRELNLSSYRAVFTQKIGTFWTESTTLNTAAVSEVKMEIYNNEAYIAYTDTLSRIVVRKFDSGNWSAIGGVATDSVCNYLDFKIHDGNPYVSFQEIPSTNLRILKHDGTSWIGMNNTTGEVDNRETFSTSLVVNPSTGNPIIAYSDRLNAEKTTVISFCDISIDLTVSSNENDGVLYLQVPQASGSATYQWFDCNNNDSPIPGLNSNSFAVSQNGSYACVITDGCATDTTECVTVDYLSIDETSGINVTLYPNPTTGILNIKNGFGSVRIMDLTGKVVLETAVTDEQIDVSNLLNGVYLLELATEKGIATQRFIKE